MNRVGSAWLPPVRVGSYQILRPRLAGHGVAPASPRFSARLPRSSCRSKAWAASTPLSWLADNVARLVPRSGQRAASSHRPHSAQDAYGCGSARGAGVWASLLLLPRLFSVSVASVGGSASSAGSGSMASLLSSTSLPPCDTHTHTDTAHTPCHRSHSVKILSVLLSYLPVLSHHSRSSDSALSPLVPFLTPFPGMDLGCINSHADLTPVNGLTLSMCG